MADRPKISIKPRAPARDPFRAPVRKLTAPRPSAKSSAKPSARPAPATPERPAERPAQGAAEHPSRRPNAPRAADAARPPRLNRPPRQEAVARPPAQAPQRAALAPAPRPTAVPASAPEGVRVSKLITERGLASRREADDWIDAGWVRVGGKLVVLGQRVASDAAIDIDPRARVEQARLVTVLVHKPIGYVSGQAEDGHEPAIVLVTPANRWPQDSSRIEFRGAHLRHLAPAGRLDIDSTGLLVFTQDGRVAKRLIGDETRVEKEYLVRVACADPGGLPNEQLERLRHGLVLDEVALRPARVSWQNEDQLRFVLREGRKRQIRRMCEQVGLQVLGLKRVRIGSVSLGPLPAGQWRFLRDDETF